MSSVPRILETVVSGSTVNPTKSGKAPHIYPLVKLPPLTTVSLDTWYSYGIEALIYVTALTFYACLARSRLALIEFSL